MKSKRIKQSILFSSVLLMGSTLFYNSSAKADTSTSSNSNTPTTGVSSPQKTSTGFNNFVDNVSAKNSSVKDKISNANAKVIDPADSAANKAKDLTSAAKKLSDKLPTGEAKQEAKQDSQEKINEATLDKYMDLEEKVPDEDWNNGFPERSDQEKYESKTNTKIIFDSPDLEISPLEDNSIIYNGKVHSYTFDNGKSSFFGFTGFEGDNKAFNITNWVGDHTPDEGKWATIDGNVLIKNSFNYDLEIVDKGAPARDIIKDSDGLGVVITDSDEESSLSIHNAFNVSELAIITPYGNVLHHVIFKNISPDPNAAEPHGFYSLIDTSLDGRDNVPIMSDGKGGLYITDGNLVYAVRPLDGHATAYATDFRVAGKDSRDNQSADRLPDSDSKVVLNNVDTAIRIATPKVALPYGQEMDFWFIETSYLLNGASDVEKSVNDHFDAEIADLLNKIDKASDSVKNAQSKADDVLGTIGKATDIDGAIDNTVKKVNNTIKQETGYDPKAIKDTADEVSSNVSDTISNVKDGYNAEKQAYNDYKNNVASTAITDEDKALANRIENSANAVERGANAIERGANTVESAGKGIIGKIAKPLQILSTIGDLKNTISDIHNSITKVNDIVDSSAATALNVLATAKNGIRSFGPISAKAMSINTRDATNAAIDVTAGKLKDSANQKINNVRKDTNKKIDDENNKVKKRTKDFLTNSGESILTTIIQSIVSVFATVFAGIAAGILLHPLIGLGAAALAGVLVNFLWTGKLFGKQLFDGINSIVKSSKKAVNSMAKTTEDTVDSVIDEAKDRFKKK